jgi:hypothetical protein
MFGTEDDLVEDLGVGTHLICFSCYSTPSGLLGYSISFLSLPPVRSMVISTGKADGYSNLTPSGFSSETPKGSNVSNTLSYAVEYPNAGKYAML